MDKKRMILLGALGAVAVFSFLQLQKMNKPAPVQQVTEQPATVERVVSKVDYVDVLVAIADIPMGTRINGESLQWARWPAEALNENLVNSDANPQAMEELLHAVARATIYAGEPIMMRKVVKSGDRGQMAAILKPGMRAISTRISVDTAAGGFIKPGDRVDLVLTTQVLSQTGGQSVYVANTIMENVHVLAIGQIYGDTSAGQAFIVATTATLELSQADAEVLIEAQSRGDLSLTLRGLDRRRAGHVPSATTTPREKSTDVTSVTVVRNGQAQQVSIQGQ